MRENKIKDISSALQKNFNTIITEMYNNKLSSIEIAHELFQKTGIKITPRFLQTVIKKLGLTRSPSERFKLAIKKGRMEYDSRRKAIKSSDLRKGITLKVRYEILKRDNFKCVACGKTAKEDLLVIDHIVPVVKGGTNNNDNLQVLCRACNHGKMLLEERYE